MASKADAVVLAVGFNAASESEGGDRNFELPVGQEQLIDQIAALGKKTIVVITSGGSVDVSNWKDKVQGIFETWYAGEEGGTAAARLLFGEDNPSGHLPISWEKQITDNPSYAHYYPDPGTNKIVYREGIFMGYRGYDHNHIEPQYPFGFGLSYTTFSFSNLKSSPVRGWPFSCNVRCYEHRKASRSDGRSTLCKPGFFHRRAAGERVERIRTSAARTWRDQASHYRTRPSELQLLRRENFSVAS